jgi:membrane-bound lytic murein transglycosylase D
MNAIMRGKSRDFWTLVKGKQLPNETMDYIPKVLAAFIIGSNPEKYGFRRPAAEAHDPVSLVAVPSPISLAKVAEVTSIPLESLQRFNPHLKTGITPPGAASYKIWVPRPEKERVATLQAELQNHRLQMREAVTAVASQDVTPINPGKRKFHRVRRGENLALIAQTYGLTVADLMQMNNLQSSRLYAGRKLRIQPEATAATQNVGETNKNPGKMSTAEARKASALASLRGDERSLSADDKDSTYRVQRGDNLESISKRFNVPVHELKKLNKLRRSRIHVGQVLLVNRDGADQG